MKLTEQSARIIQYSAIFFSAMTLTLINHPAILLPPIFMVLTLTLYISTSLKKLRKVDEDSFKIFLSISPNILAIGDKARVRIWIKYMFLDKLKGEVQVILDDGLRIEEGRANWTGLLDLGKDIVIEFIVKTDKIGLLNIGPVIIAVKDDFEFVAKVIKLNVSGVIFSFQEPLRVQGVLTSSVIRGFNQPGYTLHPFTGINEEYRESVEGIQPFLKKIDWRRTAKVGGEEVYLKEYVKRRSSDIVIGIGSGLDISISPLGDIRNWITQIIISYAIHYIREGSRIWILKYNEGKLTYTQLKISHGELILRDEAEPSGGLIIYLSRFIDGEEPKILKNQINFQRLKLEVLIIDLIEEVSNLVKEELIEYETERLRSLNTELREFSQIVKIADILDSIKRILAFR